MSHFIKISADPADSRGSRGSASEKQLHAASQTRSKCQSAEQVFKKGKEKAIKLHKQGASKQEAEEEAKEEKMKQLHAASRTRSKCQSTVAKARKLSKLKKGKGEKQSSGTSKKQQKGGARQRRGGQEGQEARGRTAMVFWPCRRVLLTGAVQNESQLQEDARKMATSSAGRQAN